MISLLDAKKVCDSLNSTKRAVEKPVNLGKRSYGSYEFTNIPMSNEHKRKEREKEKEVNQQGAEKKQKVDEATEKEKATELDLVRENIRKFAELNPDNWHSVVEYLPVVEVLTIFGINITLSDYKREKSAIDNQILGLIRKLTRTIHSDKVQPNNNDEKSFNENMSAFLSNVKNLLKNIPLE